LGRSRGRGYDFWLGLFLAGLILVSIANVLPPGASQALPLLCAISVTPLAALAPLLFQAVRRAAGYEFRRGELWHFAPVAVYAALHFTTAVFVVLGLASGAPGPSWPNIALVALGGGYLVLGYRTVLEARKRGGMGRLGWLTAGATVLWLGWLASTLFPNSITREGAQAAVFVFFYLVGWLGWRQGPAPARVQEKYANSGLTAQSEALVADRVAKFVEGEKAFLDHDLTLGRVARKVGCSPHWVSQYLNGRRGTTFFDYVNGLRVAEFVALARDPAQRDRTILELSLAAGFRNKSTFNAAFKKNLGATPREWLSGVPKDGTIGTVDRRAT